MRRTETTRRGFEHLEPRAMLAVVPTVSIADAATVEGHSGTKVLSFVVSLSSAAQQATEVRFQTSDGSATTANADYDARAGIVSFRPGQRTASVAVTIHGDRTVETDETFQVVLSNPTNCVLGDAAAIGSILDDDAAPRTVSIAGPTTAVNEGAAATFTFTLSRSSVTPVTVSYATGNLTASSGTDYVAATGSLTFAAGETSRTVSVTTLADSATESDETFQLRVVAATGASVGSPASATATSRMCPRSLRRRPRPATGRSWST